MPVADISPAAARLICERQLVERAGRWHWRSDPRLRDLAAAHERRAGPGADPGIACPVLFIRGNRVSPGCFRAQWQLRGPLFGQIEMVQVAGNHHFTWKIRHKPPFYIESSVKSGRIAAWNHVGFAFPSLPVVNCC